MEKKSSSKQILPRKIVVDGNDEDEFMNLLFGVDGVVPLKTKEKKLRWYRAQSTLIGITFLL